MKVNYLKYELIRNDNSHLVVLTANPSRYRLNIGFSNTGKTTTIEEMKLIINGQILSPNAFQPLKLERGDYKVIDPYFPIDESQALVKGTYEIQATYAVDKVCKIKGQFPIINEL